MRHLNIICITFLLLFSAGLSAQSKKAIKKFQEARQLVQQQRFADALGELDEAIEEDPSYVEALIFAGDLSQRVNGAEASLVYYEKAIAAHAPYYVDFFYGQALFDATQYEKAQQVLTRYAQHPKASSKYLTEVNRLIESCDFAMEAKKDVKEYDPVNLGEKVNTDQMEYFPSISANGKVLVFTHRNLEGDKIDEDFWVTTRDSDTSEWKQATPLRGKLNTILNEGAQSVTSSGNVIFFAACEREGGFGSCDIYASFLQKDGSWSEAVNLGPAINTPMWESQPSISSDGKTLYFVRGRTGTSKNIDIYYATLDGQGRFSKAKRLEGKVNTLKQEQSPFIHFDNQSLYFSSKGHPGMGGQDFYVSRKQPDGSWGEPQNLGYPINTPKEEFSLIVAPDGKTGYFSSDGLPGNLGSVDLYSFTLPQESQAMQIAYIEGEVVNQKTKEKLNANLIFSRLDSNTVALEENTGKDGYYFTVLPSGRDYALTIKKPGFLFYSKNFSLSQQNAEKAYRLDVELIPIEANKRVKLENVFFAYDSYEILPTSYPELDQIVTFLNDNETVKVRLEGHTDNQGGDAYNKTLSLNRAKAVITYLATKGIDENRMDAAGYGAEKPIATNDTEEGRALNRRTELLILSK